jgi:hypothetical protein
VTGSDALPWLLEPENPSARYLALTRLLDRPEDLPEVSAVRAAIPGWGPARAILDAQWPEGYWMRPGVGYSPKHKATVWQVIFLAALGAPCTGQVERACDYVLDHSRLSDGRFSGFKHGRGAFACLNGGLLRAMFQLGHRDERLGESIEALAVMVARDRFCCRNRTPGPSGGTPPARMKDGLPCAWGAIKALGAFAEVPEAGRSPAVRTAIEAGVELLLGDGRAGLRTVLAATDDPAGTEPSPLWLRFGFPLGASSDLLEALDVLWRAAPSAVPGPDRARDLALAVAAETILAKRGAGGRWALDYTPDNTWARFGVRGQPNKWVTIRALRALKGWGELGPSRR